MSLGVRRAVRGRRSRVRAVVREGPSRVGSRGESVASTTSTTGRPSLSAAALAGLGLGGITVLAYVPGIGRTYEYDESLTVHDFVATPSLLDPLRRQVVYNNHPLFSLLDHLVYSATGRSDELAMRVVPIAVAALAVAVLTAAVARRWGVVAGVIAGLVFAVNPLFVTNARQARGYSLFVLCAIVATLLLLELTEGRRSRWKEAMYVVTVAAGVLTYAYMVPVVAVHAVYLATTGRWSRAWAARLAAGIALGVLPQIAVLSQMVHASMPAKTGGIGLPVDMTVALLGGAGAAVAGCLPALLGLRVLLRRPGVLAVAGTVAAMFLLAWVLLYTEARFFLWLVPVAALCVGIAARQRLVVAAMVLIGVAAAVAPQVSGYADDPIASRDVAAIVNADTQAGQSVCVTGLDAGRLAAYTTAERVPQSLDELRACDVIVAVVPLPPALQQVVLAGHSRTRTLPAATPATVFSR